MIITGVLFILILGLLVFVHELGHFLVAKRNGVTVHEFAFGFKPRLFSWKRGGTEYAINLLPFGGYVRLEGETEDTGAKGSFAAKSPLIKTKVLVAGVTMNVILAWIVLMLAYAIGSTPLTASFSRQSFTQTNVMVELGRVAPGSPAELAGWQIGDQILTLDGQALESASALVMATKSKVGQEIRVELRRGQAILMSSLIPRNNPPAGEGALGIELVEASVVRSPLYLAPVAAAGELASQVKLTFMGIGRVLTDLVVERKVSDEASGLVGVGVATGVVRRLGIGSILQFISLISVNLALVNLLPIPPLDGGHLLFVWLEHWRKKSLEIVRGYVTMVCLGLLLLFTLSVTYKDIIRFHIIDRLF